jgi:tetratricopeptide (TPR) repeat protein
MRILQARFAGPVTMLVAGLFLGTSPGTAQKPFGGATAPSPGTGTSSPTPSPSPTPEPTAPPPQYQPTPQPIPEVTISGRVILPDGDVPPGLVTIQQVCSNNSGSATGQTDSTGHFRIRLGQNDTVYSPNRQPGAATEAMMSPLPVSWDCDLRAILPGYRSTTISLAQGRQVGTRGYVLVLYPVTGIEGLTASATSSHAPKDARKAYEKGLSAAKNHKLDQAEQEFRKAVQIYPKYADAWLELGKVLEAGKHDPEAREAYAKASAADPDYVYPYQQLYQVAVREQNWKDVVDLTDQLLQLDPYDFPNAHYFNALAHLELKEYDAAEKSAQEAVATDLNQLNPKTYYLLGAILVKKKDWTRAAESFRAYLKAAPDATDKAYVETTLSQIDQQIRLAQAASPDSGGQQKFR